MACTAVSLKRSLEYDPFHSPSPTGSKRMRCGAVSMSPSSSPSCSTPATTAAASSNGSEVSLEWIAGHLHDEVARLRNRRQLVCRSKRRNGTVAAGQIPGQMSDHIFNAALSAEPPAVLTAAEPAPVASAVGQLRADDGSGNGSSDEMDSSSPSISPLRMADSVVAAAAAAAVGSDNDKEPVLTIPQAMALLERLLKEKLAEQEEKFTRILQDQLREQYNQFVQYNMEMRQRQLADKPMSYVS